MTAPEVLVPSDDAFPPAVTQAPLVTRPAQATITGCGPLALDPVNGGGTEAGGQEHERGLVTLWRRFEEEVERKRARREMEDGWRQGARP